MDALKICQQQRDSSEAPEYWEERDGDEDYEINDPSPLPRIGAGTTRGDKHNMDYMTRQEAESILVDMFPPHAYTIWMQHITAIGGCGMSEVTASIYRAGQEMGEVSKFRASAYDEHDDRDQGGWATVVTRIREQVEALQ